MTIDHGMVSRAAQRLVKGALASIVLAGLANAATITTTNFNTWKSAAYQSGAPTGLNFMAINSGSYNTASGITLSGGGSAATFVGLNSGGTYFLAGDIYNKMLSGAASAAASINISFAAPQNAFMLFFGNSVLPYTITLSDGQIFNATTKAMGFSVSHGISSIKVATTPGNQAVINDFYFGVSSLAQDAAPSPDPEPATTPEPATMMLLAGGVLFLAGAKRSVRFCRLS